MTAKVADSPYCVPGGHLQGRSESVEHAPGNDAAIAAGIRKAKVESRGNDFIIVGSKAKSVQDVVKNELCFLLSMNCEEQGKDCIFILWQSLPGQSSTAKEVVNR